MNLPGRPARDHIRARLKVLEVEHAKQEQMLAAMVELLDAQQVALLQALARLSSLTDGKA
jgi:uncharacterized coiled-coil protein SlyX